MFPFKQPALLLAAECELLHENTTLKFSVVNWKKSTRLK